MPQLHFEQHVAASGGVGRIGTVQHQALAADFQNFIQLLLKRLAIFDLDLLDHLQPGQVRLADQLANTLRTRPKITRRLWQLINNVAHLTPFGIVRRLPAHRAREPVKLPACDP